MTYYVYILECADKTLYIGTTNDLEKRLHKHNHAKSGAKYTRARRPVVMRYSERKRNLSNALKREAALKRLSRSQKIELIRNTIKA